MKKVFPLLILLLSNLSISQDQTTNLDEVVVLSTTTCQRKLQTKKKTRLRMRLKRRASKEPKKTYRF